MTELSHIQSLFQKAVMTEETEFLHHIAEGGKLSPEKRLYIYQHAYRARLRDILTEDFPVLHSMLGDEAFYELGNRYIDAYPSTHPSLRFFGQHLEELVSAEAPYRSQKIIAEMARFEWIFHDVFDAADAHCISIEDVACLSPVVWTTLRFKFHPSLHMASYYWNVAAVWASVQNDEEQPTLPVEMPEMTHIIQWRHDLKSYYRTLDSDEGDVLKRAMEFKAFPEICELLVPFHGDEAAARAAALLKRWVAEGLIVQLDYADLPA